MGTVVEVRDEHGGVVTESEGQVFIGGRNFQIKLEINDPEVSKIQVNLYAPWSRWRRQSVSPG